MKRNKNRKTPSWYFCTYLQGLFRNIVEQAENSGIQNELLDKSQGILCAFDEAFEDVNNKQKRILQLYFVGELSYSEIAEHERVSYYQVEKTVRTIVQAVDEKLEKNKENEE
jgi:DNA-directed RNA polymerase specialized sigma subunit, sigma24 homolog